jgi:lycopene cyclase domain-containing protein
MGLLVTIGALNYSNWYTAVTFFSLALFLSVLHYGLNVNYLGRFYAAYLFILIPFFLINGILTGSFIEEQVVWYNDAENMGLRMGTIPFEDTFYGMLLILMNVSILEWLQTRSNREA